ncbi:MAG: hypothetical protein ACYTAF_05810 [Planctomycetota bacterium]|jgi:hypothetical protein
MKILWRSIDEASGSGQVVVLRGILVTTPRSYRRGAGALTLGSLSRLLMRFVSFSAAITAHLIIAVLFLLIVMAPPSGSEDSGVDMGIARFARAEGGTPRVEEAGGSAAPIGTGLSDAGDAEPLEDAARLIEQDPLAAVGVRRAGVLGRLRRGKDREVVVVRGRFDRLEDVLLHLRIPHRSIDFGALADLDLSETGVILLNCDSRFSMEHWRYWGDPERIRGDRTRTLELIGRLQKGMAAAQAGGEEELAEEIRRKIRAQETLMSLYDQGIADAEKETVVLEKIAEFLEGGGYLCTSDWALTILERAVPGYVGRGGAVEERKVPIRPHRRAEDHALLQEVFPDGPLADKLRWEIHGNSYLIADVDPGVEWLVETPALEGNRAVAVTFRHGRGRVLHVLSHFSQQGSPVGEYVLQNMLLNFLVERVDQD